MAKYLAGVDVGTTSVRCAIFDLAGSYFHAFIVGLAFNALNLVLVVPLFRRERRQSAEVALAAE